MVTAAHTQETCIWEHPLINRPLRLLWSAKPWRAAAYLAASVAIGNAWFFAILGMLIAGLGLAVTFFGIPLLILTMVVWTWGARSERAWIRLVMGVDIPAPYRPLPKSPRLHRLQAFISDPAVWKDLAYVVVRMPLSYLNIVVAGFAVFVPLYLLTMPLWFPYGGEGPAGGTGTVWFMDWGINSPIELITAWLLGFPALLAMPYALTATAGLNMIIARSLLAPGRGRELEERVDELTESRSRVMDAALAERRRIERDLHDGAQQRLVALAMDLGMAKIKMDSDPEMARTLVDEAHKEAKAAMMEIRNLVQGIHPAVLTDRGLDAALSALAARCPIPVAVDAEIDDRLPAVLESAAYFFVSEALTNVAKHSAATEAYVFARRIGSTLIVEVDDNGLGGADPEGGTGLAGLRDRVLALDGRLLIDSPVGRGTRLRVELPCA